MNEPVRRSWSLEELRTAAVDYMREDFGLPPKDDAEARDRWHERLGLLSAFAHSLWERQHHNG